MLVESGIDCIDPIDPLGGMDMRHVREEYGSRVARKGNVDCVHVLTEGSPAQVEEAVKKCIRAGSPGGGHIISSSNSLHAGIDPTLYRVMLETIQKYGEYPIRL
jgi:uroporphyrinogen decarboxylase